MSNSSTTETTNEFCETFQRKEDCTGFYCWLIPSCLPDGVDPSDPRVIQIVKWCKENIEESVIGRVE